MTQCQVRWKNGRSDFIDGYQTLATTKILSIENFNRSQLIESITEDKKQLIVDLIVIENFKGMDIYDSKLKADKPSQSENISWLLLRYNECLVSKLRDDGLSNYKSALKLVRRYRKVFTIQKNTKAGIFDKLISNNWIITDIDNKEVGLIYDSTFYYK